MVPLEEKKKGRRNLGFLSNLQNLQVTRLPFFSYYLVKPCPEKQNLLPSVYGSTYMLHDWGPGQTRWGPITDWSKARHSHPLLRTGYVSGTRGSERSCVFFTTQDFIPPSAIYPSGHLIPRSAPPHPTVYIIPPGISSQRACNSIVYLAS